MRSVGMRFAICVVLAVLSTAVFADTTFAREALQPFVDSGEIAGAISVLYRDGVQETACLGYADREACRAITLDDPFMQCSQTKGFCGVTVAMLVEEGLLSLDDPVSRFLPEFADLWVETSNSNGVRTLKKASRGPTVREVMNHTSGIRGDLPNMFEMGGWQHCMPLRSAAATAAAQPLLFDPGSRVKYSSLGIDVGAAVVEQVSGMRWEDFLRKRVLDPLEMRDTGFRLSDEQWARRIVLYDVTPGERARRREEPRWMQRPYDGVQIFPSAGAGLWTTARDQLKFYKMLMNLGVGENGVRILKAETVRGLLAKSSRPKGMGGYSLGFVAPEEDGPDAWFGHGGAWNTQCSVNWHRRELKQWVVQFYGEHRWRMCKRERESAAERFFRAKSGNSEIDAYTGRLIESE